MDAITAAVAANGKIKLYSGTQPAGGGAPTGTLLGTLTCSATFAPAASGGVITLNAVTSDSNADATGTASWFRITTSADAFVLDGDVTQTGGGGDLELDNINIVLNGTIALSGPNTFTASNPP